MAGAKAAAVSSGLGLRLRAPVATGGLYISLVLVWPSAIPTSLPPFCYRFSKTLPLRNARSRGHLRAAEAIRSGRQLSRIIPALLVSMTSRPGQVCMSETRAADPDILPP